MSQIDKLNTEYIALTRRLTDSIFQLIQQGQTKEDILQILSSGDFKRTILNDPQFKKAFDSISVMYVSALSDIEQFADITENTLLALTKVNQSTFISKLAEDMVTNVQGNLTRGVLSGLSKDQIIANIQSELRPDQVETLITTALNTYTASINSIMADKLPQNTTYIYRGPIDSRTRDVCLKFAATSPMTRKDIEAMLPGSFIERGGFNCRHQWVPEVKDQAFFFPKEAKKLAQDKGVSLG